MLSASTAPLLLCVCDVFLPAARVSAANRCCSAVILHYGDMADSSNIMSIVNSVRPDEVYNLAAQSHVKVSVSRNNNKNWKKNSERTQHCALVCVQVSFEMPEYTAGTTTQKQRKILLCFLCAKQ